MLSDNYYYIPKIIIKRFGYSIKELKTNIYVSPCDKLYRFQEIPP